MVMDKKDPNIMFIKRNIKCEKCRKLVNLNDKCQTKGHTYICKGYIYTLHAIFICLCEFIVPLENFSLIWRGHHCRWRAANFDCTHGHCNCAVRVLLCATSNVTRTYPLKWSSPRTRYRAFGSGASCFSSVATGDRNPISRMRGERSTSTLPRR